jgi:hypothetical protein
MNWHGWVVLNSLSHSVTHFAKVSAEATRTVALLLVLTGMYLHSHKADRDEMVQWICTNADQCSSAEHSRKMGYCLFQTGYWLPSWYCRQLQLVETFGGLCEVYPSQYPD